ncbi:MAG: beta-N-acetylglucosaminidase domain-containing protein [Pseudomonadota bacterium]
MMPNCQTDVLRGVVEGFYGRPWSFEVRRDYARFIADLGLNTYLYCPKSDPYLRKQWQSDWPNEQWLQLKELAATYRTHGVYFGVGLSPFALYLDYSATQRRRLQQKLTRLAELDLPLLAVLFDDMPGDIDALADRQAEIMGDIINWLPATRILMCPTYYSFDPVLEKHFGEMPEDYWTRLGRELPQEMDIFWTGNRVCSETIERGDIQQICDLLGRPPLLWDNYPVNDGAVRSQFLYLESLPGRDRLPTSLLRGHLCNPMNQALLSLPALSGLAELYETHAVAAQWLGKELGAKTWAQLQADKQTFSSLGLDNMGSARRAELAEMYQRYAEPATIEVVQWLSGHYTFDPSCLTD